MTITCPSCAASYRIDLDALGQGRRVRCKRCRADWFALGAEDKAVGAEEGWTIEPIADLDEAAAIDAIEISDPSEGSDQPEVAAPTKADARARFPRIRGVGAALQPRRIASRVRPAALFAAASLAACVALVSQRDAAVRAAPSLASLYGAIGLPVNVRGLAISDIRSVERIEEGVPLLMVTGAIENVSGAPIDVPRLRLAVTGAGERELYAWTAVAMRAKLEPGHSTQFRARLASPPADGRTVAVRFLARRDLVATASR